MLPWLRQKPRLNLQSRWVRASILSPPETVGVHGCDAFDRLGSNAEVAKAVLGNGQVVPEGGGKLVVTHVVVRLAREQHAGLPPLHHREGTDRRVIACHPGADRNQVAGQEHRNEQRCRLADPAVQRIKSHEREGDEDPEIDEDNLGQDERSEYQAEPHTVPWASPVEHPKREERGEDEQRGGVRLRIEPVDAHQELAVLRRKQERAAREPGGASQPAHQRERDRCARHQKHQVDNLQARIDRPTWRNIVDHAVPRHGFESNPLASAIHHAPDHRHERLAKCVAAVATILAGVYQPESERQVLVSIVRSGPHGEIAHTVDEHCGAQTGQQGNVAAWQRRCGRTGVETFGPRRLATRPQHQHDGNRREPGEQDNLPEPDDRRRQEEIGVAWPFVEQAAMMKGAGGSAVRCPKEAHAGHTAVLFVIDTQFVDASVQRDRLHAGRPRAPEH